MKITAMHIYQYGKFSTEVFSCQILPCK
ncbi:hypothetical protein B938_04870 [Bacillus velezensis AS43.3]|nr:hypothetical protein B938_04870 [Bacillus velezensis AS43.3]